MTNNEFGRSNACRQRHHRRKQNSTLVSESKAHQRVIRERLAQTEPRTNINTAVVREIALPDAARLISNTNGGHHARSRAARLRHLLRRGAWRRGGVRRRICRRISVCGTATAREDHYPATPACAHWAHPHAASKLIRRSMDLLPERYKVITATVDAIAGEIGTIYQACGFDYVGTMHRGVRAHITAGGRTMSERRAGLIAGTQGRRALAALGFVPPLCPVGRDLPVSRIAHRAQGPAARDCAPDPALSSEDRRQSMARGSVLILQACSALQRTPIRYPQRYPSVIVR